VDTWPKADRTIYSQRGIILCSIALNDQAAAAAVEKLLADYADSKYVPEIVRSIAVEYYRKGKLDQSRELHQYVVDKHPKSDEALWCQRDIAFHYIDTANKQAAEEALQKLVTAFAANARLPEALADVGEHYRSKKDFANARNVHQEVVKRFPSSDEAILSQRNLILSNVGLNDELQIEAGIETLLTRFAKDKDIAPVLCYVADRLGHWKIADRVKLYERIIDQYPKHEIVVRAKAKLGAIKIRQGDQTGGEAIFQKIMEDYASHPRLPEALHVTASGYYDRALELQNQNRKPPASEAPPILQEPPQQVRESYAKAIEKWSILLQRYPRVTNASAMALYCSAVSYSAMGEPAKAVECYQTLLAQWPEDERNHHALLRLPDLYKQMILKGVLSEQQARPLIKAAYEKLVQKYPDSPVAQIARERIRFYATPVEGQIHEP
jgi:TolA-binding protein